MGALIATAIICLMIGGAVGFLTAAFLRQTHGDDPDDHLGQMGI